MAEMDRLEKLKRDIRRRLASVCSHMDESTFEELVTSIAENELKALRRAAGLKVDPVDVLPMC